MNLFRRQPQETPMAAQAETTEQSADVVMRFLTAGGATVELRSHRFITYYTWKGRPYVSDETREVDGFVWECLGCDADGRRGISIFDGLYLPDERGQARDDANKHAEACRAMPKSEA